MTGIDPGTSDPGVNFWHLPAVHPTWQNPPYTPITGRIRTWWAAAGSLHSGEPILLWETVPSDLFRNQQQQRYGIGCAPSPEGKWSIFLNFK